MPGMCKIPTCSHVGLPHVHPTRLRNPLMVEVGFWVYPESDGKGNPIEGAADSLSPEEYTRRFG